MLTAHRQLAGDMCGERGLAHAAFLVEQSDDHGLASLLGKPGVDLPAKPANWWLVLSAVGGRVVVVHRSGVSLLKVR
ncbi:MAG TPA: hypothetical protein PLA28_11085, partial [Ottowia sp.]|nr:hypothetical protein [Ottowia sp.]